MRMCVRERERERERKRERERERKRERERDKDNNSFAGIFFVRSYVTNSIKQLVLRKR